MNLYANINTIFIFLFKWCPDAESNHGHRDFQSLALPTELSGHMAGELGFEPRHLAISPVFKTGPLAVRTSTHNLKIYIVITSKKIPHLIWFLKKMVRPRGVEPLLPG